MELDSHAMYTTLLLVVCSKSLHLYINSSSINCRTHIEIEGKTLHCISGYLSILKKKKTSSLASRCRLLFDMACVIVHEKQTRTERGRGEKKNHDIVDTFRSSRYYGNPELMAWQKKTRNDENKLDMTWYA